MLLGVKAPTGRTSARTDGGSLFDAEFQPGSGSWDGIFGAAVSQQLRGPLSFHANVQYVLTTTGSQHTDLGDRLLYNAAFVYRLAGFAGSPVGALAHSELGGHRHFPPVLKAAPPPPSGGGYTPAPPAGGGDRTLWLILSYLGILSLIPWLAKKDDAEVQWHAENGVALFPGPAFPSATLPTPPISATYCLPSMRYVIGGPMPLRSPV